VSAAFRLPGVWPRSGLSPGGFLPPSRPIPRKTVMPASTFPKFARGCRSAAGFFRGHAARLVSSRGHSLRVSDLFLSFFFPAATLASSRRASGLPAAALGGGVFSVAVATPSPLAVPLFPQSPLCAPSRLPNNARPSRSNLVQTVPLARLGIIPVGNLCEKAGPHPSLVRAEFLQSASSLVRDGNIGLRAFAGSVKTVFVAVTSGTSSPQRTVYVRLPARVARAPKNTFISHEADACANQTWRWRMA